MLDLLGIKMVFEEIEVHKLKNLFQTNVSFHVRYQNEPLILVGAST